MARGTKKETIRKFIDGEEVSGHSRFYYVLSDGATADNATIVIWRDDGRNGERDMKRAGYITASVVDTEIRFDETRCGTKSLPVIKQVEHYLMEVMAKLGGNSVAQDGKSVLVIPISKIHELVGKNINGYNIVGIYIYFNGSYHLTFATEESELDALAVLGCDVEVINE